MPAPKTAAILDYPNLETLLDRITPENKTTFYTGLATYTLKDKSYTYLGVYVVTETAQHRWRLPLNSTIDFQQRHRLLAIIDDHIAHYFPSWKVKLVHALPNNIIDDYRTGKREPYDDTVTAALTRDGREYYLTPHEQELVVLYLDTPLIGKTPYEMFKAAHQQDMDIIYRIAEAGNVASKGIPNAVIAEYNRVSSLLDDEPQYDCHMTRLNAILQASGPDQTPLDQEREKVERVKADFVKRFRRHWQMDKTPGKSKA